MDQPTYLNAQAYYEMLGQLIEVRPTFRRPCLRSAIIEILGEVGNVWPGDLDSAEENQQRR